MLMAFAHSTRWILVCLLLTACGQSGPPQPPAPVPEAETETEVWPQGGQLARLDAARSSLRIRVFSAGRAAALGHNHVLTAPWLQGALWTPLEGLEGARFSLSLRLDELEIDRPQERAALGPAFATPLDAQAIAGTREHMLGPDNLDAARHPWVRMHSIGIQGTPPELRVDVDIELHGRHQRRVLPLRAWREAGAWRTQGTFTVLQSDFGVTPYSVLGGLLAVQDALQIDFDLSLGSADPPAHQVLVEQAAVR